MLITVEPAVHPFLLAPSLSSSAQKIYDVLRQAGELVKNHRGYHKNTSQITYFAPLEVVALVAGVSRQTVYNKLTELSSKGLVAQRGHFTSLNGSTRSDGSLWCVRLSGEGPVSVEFDYLKKSHRNLGVDITQRRTAWQLLQSKQQENKLVEIDSILSFAISPHSQANTDDCKNKSGGSLEELMDLPFLPKEGINKAVDNVASTIAGQLGATESVMFYRWLIWNLLRLEKQGNDRFYAVFLLIQRVSIAKKEGASNNPSGLFVSKLKQSSIWDELRAVKHTRIGLTPWAT